jgi:hypothetical protein
MAVSQIPTPAAPLTDPTSGRITVPWFQFLLRLVQGVGSFAPGDGGYIVTGPDAELPNARVATDSPTVDVDLTVPGIIRWHALGGTGSGWAPLSTGAEPLVLVSDGAGQCVMVPYP